MVVKLLVNSCGIRGIGRVLGISPTTVLKRIINAAQSLPKPATMALGKTYEIDELRTFIGNKKHPCWICLAMQVETRSIVAISIGHRSKRKLSQVVQTVLHAQPQRILTDGLVIYRNLIPSAIHIVKGHCTNHIERFNLSLRTSLKRLSRKTICYSRSLLLLACCVRIFCAYAF
jgi:insertion element IS1 protein InsB